MILKEINKRAIYNSRAILVIALLIGFLYSCNKTEKPWTINAKIKIDDISQAYLYKVIEVSR